MPAITYTSTTHGAELLEQDAVVRSTHFSDDRCTLQLSCRKGFANISLDGTQLADVMAGLGLASHEQLPGTKVLAYAEAARIVGIGAR